MTGATGPKISSGYAGRPGDVGQHGRPVEEAVVGAARREPRAAAHGSP